jgi:RNA ligase (TIGR02306 family)
MSTFAVEVVRLDAIEAHPNADALEFAVIGGYRAIVQKGLHKAGDIVVYVPEAAVVPQDIIDAFGFTGKLAGKDKNRVKAIRLRGELSQGLVLSLRRVLDVLITRGDGVVQVISEHRDVVPTETDSATLLVGWGLDGFLHVLRFRGVHYGASRIEPLIGEDIADLMGIVKYEPPIPPQMEGKARPRPEWFPYYTDIENIKRYNRTLVPGEEVVVCEKAHGSNVGFGMHKDFRYTDEDAPDILLIGAPELFVSSRRVMLKMEASNLYWRAALQEGVYPLLRYLLTQPNVTSVILWGEVIGHGVQDLAYGHLPGSIGFRWFDLMVNGMYVSEDEAHRLITEARDATGTAIERVPVLYRGPFADEVVASLTDGQDLISNSHIREGVVVKPVIERAGGRTLSRVILKSVSADYLCRKGGTEYN